MSANDRAERARAAVKAFNAMLYSLNGYARALGGGNIRVEIGERSESTKGLIRIRPPMALGDNTPHERLYCDKRDSVTGQQRCPACRVREEVLVDIYHELAHNLYGTFDKPTVHAVQEAMVQSSSWPKIKAKIGPQYTLPSSYMELAGKFSEFGPLLFNALEDTRIDEAMSKARPGVRVMRHADTKRVFSEGIERSDGTFYTWKEAPLNSQIIIGLYLIGAEFDYAGYFHEDVEKALGDEKLQDLLKDVKETPSAKMIFAKAYPILERLKELGFCKEESDPEPEPEDSDEQGDSTDESDGGSDEADQDQGEADESGDGDPSGDGGAADASGGQDDDRDDGADQQAATPDREQGDRDSQSEPEASDEGGEDGSDADQGEASSGSESGELGPESEDGPSEEEDRELRPDSGESGDESSDEEGGDGTEEPVPTEDGGSGDGDEESDELEASSDESSVEPRPELGSAEEAMADFREFTNHPEPDYALEDSVDPGHEDSREDQDAIAVAVVQGRYFDTTSKNVTSVNVIRLGQPKPPGFRSLAWAGRPDTNLEVPESAVGPVLMHMRRIFTDNQRASFQRNLKSGKINARVLGKRAWNGDPRLFQKKRFPGKKSYAVLIGLDISGSTTGINNHLIKRAAMAQADVCHRLGVDFAVMAHTASSGSSGWGETTMDIYIVKDFQDPWDEERRSAMSRLRASYNNLDGHTLEFYRKAIEKTDATDKVILYYTDGAMPAENRVEELGILQREIQYCKQRKITLAGVGIRTDSPNRHGLETVQVDTDQDLVLVMDHLERVMLHRR